MTGFSHMAKYHLTKWPNIVWEELPFGWLEERNRWENELQLYFNIAIGAGGK